MTAIVPAFRAPLVSSVSSPTTISADDLSLPGQQCATANQVTLVETTPNASDIFKANDVVMLLQCGNDGFATVGVSGRDETVSYFLQPAI